MDWITFFASASPSSVKAAADRDIWDGSWVMPSHSAPSFHRGWPSLAAKPPSTAASGEQAISSPVSSFFWPSP